MKLLGMGLLLLGACAWPMEEHGGASPRPAPSDLLFVAGGAMLDGGLQIAKVPPLLRVVADVTAAVLVRTWKPLGRTEASHLLILTGSFSIEWLGVVLRGHP